MKGVDPSSRKGQDLSVCQASDKVRIQSVSREGFQITPTLIPLKKTVHLWNRWNNVENRPFIN